MVRRLTITTLFLYAASVIGVTIFPIRVHPASYWTGEPWWTVLRWVPGDVDAPSFVLNVIMFLPLGVLLPLLRPALDDLRRLALVAAAASLAIEVTQFLLGIAVGSRRTVDVNDLIANTAGAVLGLLILWLAVPFRQHRARCAGTTPSGRAGPLGLVQQCDELGRVHVRAVGGSAGLVAPGLVEAADVHRVEAELVDELQHDPLGPLVVAGHRQSPPAVGAARGGPVQQLLRDDVVEDLHHGVAELLTDPAGGDRAVVERPDPAVPLRIVIIRVDHDGLWRGAVE